MNGVPSFFDSREKLECEPIAAAMFASNSPEELLKIFLTGLGESLAVNRVALYQLTNESEGNILVEAVSSKVQSIRNQTYPISYFGIDDLKNHPCDRAIISSGIAQIIWQKTQVQAMMSAPILFDSLTECSKIWGLAFVQQCDRVREWQPQEAHFLFELSQALSQCLQSWELSLRSPTLSQSLLVNGQAIEESRDREEFIAKRIELSEDLEVTSSPSDPNTDNIVVSSNFILSDDDQNEIFDRIHFKDRENSINHAINLAMQRLT
jgi:GAF domain-containing protein